MTPALAYRPPESSAEDSGRTEWNAYSITPRMMTSAMLKEIINPVTSSNVATNVAEDVAGWAPILRMTKGTMRQQPVGRD